MKLTKEQREQERKIKAVEKAKEQSKQNRKNIEHLKRKRYADNLYMKGYIDKIQYNRILGISPTSDYAVREYYDSIRKDILENNETFGNYKVLELETLEPHNFTLDIVANCDNLESKTCKELEKICVMYDLKKSGKKAEKISTIKAYVSNFLYLAKTIDENTSKTDVLTFLFESGMIDSITRHIIKKTAGNAQSQQSGVCQQIVNSYWKDAMYDDIKGSICEILTYMFNENLIKWSDSRLIYREILKDEEGHEVGYGDFIPEYHTGMSTTYIYLYKAMRKCISDFKYENRNTTKAIDENNGFDVHTIFSCENKRDFILFLQYLKNHDEKNYDSYVAILQGIYSDTPYSEIGETIGVNERRVKYLASKLFDYTKQYFVYNGKVAVHNITYLKYKDKKQSVIVNTVNGKYVSAITGKTINTEEMHSTPKKGLAVYHEKYLIH